MVSLKNVDIKVREWYGKRELTACRKTSRTIKIQRCKTVYDIAYVHFDLCKKGTDLVLISNANGNGHLYLY